MSDPLYNVVNSFPTSLSGAVGQANAPGTPTGINPSLYSIGDPLGFAKVQPGQAFNQAQLTALAQYAGFKPGADSQLGALIALAESSGNPLAQHRNSDGSIDYGLFQINGRAHPEILAGNWADPIYNARIAAKIFNTQGTGPWKSSEHNSSGTGWGDKYTHDVAHNSDLGNTVGAIGSSAVSGLESLAGVGQFFSFLTDPSSWKRILLVLGGIILLIIVAISIVKGK